jgi:hypothetical protein
MPSPRRSRAEWSQLVAAWRASGTLSGDYARLHGLNHNTFAWWCSRFNQEETRSPIRLVPVRATESAVASSPTIEVALPSGVVVRVPADADPSRAALLVRALVSSC